MCFHCKIENRCTYTCTLSYNNPFKVKRIEILLPKFQNTVQLQLSEPFWSQPVRITDVRLYLCFLLKVDNTGLEIKLTIFDERFNRLSFGTLDRSKFNINLIVSGNVLCETKLHVYSALLHDSQYIDAKTLKTQIRERRTK